jgi:hypothetical protein
MCNLFSEALISAAGQRRLFLGRWFWIGLLAIILVGCAGRRPPAIESASPAGADEVAQAVADLFMQQLGTRWYALYDDDLKVGWARVTKSRRSGFFSSGGGYRIEIDQSATLQINGYGHRFRNSLQMDFSGAPPFRLTRFKLREDLNDHVSRREIVNTDKDGRLIIVDGDFKTTRRIGVFDYDLQDALAIEQWLRQAPSLGDTLRMTYIDPDKLKRASGAARVVSVENESGDSIPARLYHIEHPLTGLGATASVFKDDGQLVSRHFRSGFEMQRATESEARAPAPRADLYVRSMPIIATTIGRSDEVRRVEFQTDARTFQLLSDASGQRVRRAPDSDGFRIILDRKTPFNEAAFQSEIERALEVPPALNDEGASLLQSARLALKGIDDKHRQVERLLTFVDDAVEDSNEIISPSLAYALDKQKGDCSEHAALFEALARAFEIPCRTVTGLVYMGDWAQSFGLHAWNEVVLDDHWHPVDVTRRSMQLPPFYIRFPLDAQKREKLYEHVARMEIKVLKVEKSAVP